MPRLNVTINVNGRPAQRVYVEHIVFGVPIGLYMTDDQGRIRDNAGDLGIDSLTGNSDVRILGQNSVARILNGLVLGAMVPIWVDKPVRNGTTINLNTPGEYVDHFRILNLAIQNYDRVHRQFAPFSSLRNADFPLGKKRNLHDTKEQAKRIEIVFPDSLPQPLAFSEPKSLSTGFPLIHVKKNSEDERLFGTGGQRPTLIPAELSHALHFSLMTEAARDRITRDYVSFILSNLAGGGAGTHAVGVRTSYMVAYIEAMDHFSTRFSEFLRARISSNTGVALRRDFVTAELTGAGTYWLTGEPQVGVRTGRRMTPNFTGGDDEGAIYGAIFVDFASRVTLATAVGAYYQSRALTFGEYRTWIHNNRPRHTAAIDAVAQTWGL